MPAEKQPLLLNLDATSISYAQGTKLRGLVAPSTRACKAKYRRFELRGCCTLVSIICNNSAIQPLLPQVIITNGRWLNNTAVAATRDARPAQVVMLRQNSAWNNADTMCHILALIADALKGFPQYQPILFLDTAPCHLQPAVLQKASALSLFKAPVPAGLTYLLQPLDTHCFAGLKHRLRRQYQQVRSAEGHVSAEQFLVLLFGVSVHYLCSKRWIRAFDATGLSGAGHTLTRELAVHFPGGWHVDAVSCLLEEEVAVLLPRRHSLRASLWLDRPQGRRRRLRLYSGAVPVTLV